MRERIRLAKADREIVGLYALLKRSDIPQATEKRRVSVDFHFGPGDRHADVDARLKSLLDALVSCGLLRDDSERWCELGPWLSHRGVIEGRETVITLESVGNGTHDD